MSRAGNRVDRTQRRRAGWALSATTLLLAACQASGVSSGIQISGVESTTPALLAAGGAALIQGNARGPAVVAGGNLVSNNGGSIVAGNSSRYRLASLQELPLTKAIVYLTDPQEHFYASGGKPVMATTDGSGHYDFGVGLPTNQVIIANVMLADNRREVGFAVVKAGQNVIDVSLATTYVTEFLRDRALKAGKKMGDYDLTQLSQLTSLTQQALDNGDLAVPDLAIGKISDLDQAYALAVGLNKDGLGDAWAKVLGQRVLAVTTLAGTGDSGSAGDGGPATQAQLYKPKGIAWDAQGNYYIADEGNHEVRKIAADGTISTFVGVGLPRFSGDGGPSTQAGLFWPRTVTVGPDGNLYVADTLNMRIRKVDLKTGIITTFAGNPDQANGSFLNDFGGDGGPATQAKLAGVRGFAWDSKGDLIFADTWKNDGGDWNHIRMIAPDGTISTLVGVDGQSSWNGDGLPGTQTTIDYVQQVAVDSKDNIYFADANHHRIRRYDAVTHLVTTVVGTGNAASGPDGLPGPQTDLNSPYGVAVDKQGDLFFTDRAAHLVRVLPPGGTVRTLAGQGGYAGDGEADSVEFFEPHDVDIEPDGNLLICDARGARVRRLWLQWGF